MKIGVVSDVHLEFGRGGLVIEKLPEELWKTEWTLC
jgi:hypothetical protein